MQWEFIVALVIAIPLILFPAAFIWYMNVGGIFSAVRKARERRAAVRRAGLQNAALEQVSAVTRREDSK
jgi:hypothetical protein